jgi:hypothetical protein
MAPSYGYSRFLGDSVESLQPDELQSDVRPCHRNGRASVTSSGRVAVGTGVGE